MSNPKNKLSGQIFKGVSSINGFKVIAFIGAERERAGITLVDLTPEQIDAHGIGHGNPVEVMLSDEGGYVRITEIVSVTKSARQLAQQQEQQPVLALA